MTDLLTAVHRGIQKSSALKDFFFDTFYRRGSQQKLDDMRNMDQIRHLIDLKRSTYPAMPLTTQPHTAATARYRALHEASKSPTDVSVGNRLAGAVTRQVGRSPVFQTGTTSQYDPGKSLDVQGILQANRINSKVGLPTTPVQDDLTTKYLPGTVQLTKNAPAAITAHELGHAVQYQKDPRKVFEYGLPAHRLAAELDASRRGMSMIRQVNGPQAATKAQSLLRSAYGTYEAGTTNQYNKDRQGWMTATRENIPVGAKMYYDNVRKTYPVYGFAENARPNRLPAWPFKNYQQPAYYKNLSETLQRHSAVQKPGLAASRAVSKGTPGTTDSY